MANIGFNFNCINLQFMPWKKKYFHLLKADKNAYLDMEEQMRLNKMVSLELYLPSLIRQALVI